jgi:hypothetical protein
MEDEQLKAQVTSLQGDKAQLCAQMDQLSAARDGLMRANDSVRAENGHGDVPAARSECPGFRRKFRCHRKLRGPRDDEIHRSATNQPARSL